VLARARRTFGPVIEIDVDIRERDCTLARALARRSDVALRVRTLKAGDYAVGPSLGVERKTLHDLARSVIDGRLFRQAAALARRYPRPLLLVEGPLPTGPVLNVSAEALRGALVSLAAVFRIPTLHARGPDEAAALLVTAARQLEKTFDDGYVRSGYRPRALRSRRLYVLQGFPGVGPRRAAALLDRFGSIVAILQADDKALRAVKSIGPAIIAAIRKVLGPGIGAGDPCCGGDGAEVP
jgi:ERCC4-type nuclease